MNSAFQTAAFTASTPLLKLHHHSQSSRNLRRNSLPFTTRVSIRACTPPSVTEDDTKKQATVQPTPNKKSKTEEIGALLGQDRQQMEAKAEAVKEQAALDNKRKYTYALASIAVSTAIFLIQYTDPERDLTLMKVMKQTSDPVEVVGTNGKPTMIEFSANWCDNCRAMAKRVYELENEFEGKVNFVYVDGEDPDRQNIVDQYGVDGVPQFSMVDRNGKVLGNLIGMVPKEALKMDLEAMLDSSSLPFPGISIEELRAPFL